MALHTFGGKFNVTLAELQVQNAKISSIVKDNSKIEINASSSLTEAEINTLNSFLQGKEMTAKSEYAALTLDSQKLDYIAQKLGLK